MLQLEPSEAGFCTLLDRAHRVGGHLATICKDFGEDGLQRCFLEIFPTQVGGPLWEAFAGGYRNRADAGGRARSTNVMWLKCGPATAFRSK